MEHNINPLETLCWTRKKTKNIENTQNLFVLTDPLPPPPPLGMTKVFKT